MLPNDGVESSKRSHASHTSPRRNGNNVGTIINIFQVYLFQHRAKRVSRDFEHFQQGTCIHHHPQSGFLWPFVLVLPPSPPTPHPPILTLGTKARLECYVLLGLVGEDQHGAEHVRTGTRRELLVKHGASTGQHLAMPSIVLGICL